MIPGTVDGKTKVSWGTCTSHLYKEHSFQSIYLHICDYHDLRWYSNSQINATRSEIIYLMSKINFLKSFMKITHSTARNFRFCTINSQILELLSTKKKGIQKILNKFNFMLTYRDMIRKSIRYVQFGNLCFQPLPMSWLRDPNCCQVLW